MKKTDIERISDVLNKMFDNYPIYRSEALVVCSTSLYLLCITDDLPNDVDVILTGKAWRLMEEKYGYVETVLGGKKINIEELKSEIPIEFFDSMGHGLNVEECFKNSIKIIGLYDVRLRVLNPIDSLRWYTSMGREKDKEKCEKIRKYLRGE